MECMSERVGKQSSDTDEKNIVNNVQTTDLDHDCNASASAKTLTSSCEQNNGSVDISRCSLPSSNDQNSETSSCGHVTTVSSSGQSTVVPSSGQSTVVSSSGQNIPDSCNFSHHSKLTTENKTRLCPGHERALPIQQTVLDLDVKEEGMSLLSCSLQIQNICLLLLLLGLKLHQQPVLFGNFFQHIESPKVFVNLDITTNLL